MGKFIVLSGPSGSGKTTLVKKLIKYFSKQNITNRIITYTTREPRTLEVKGQDYYFINSLVFENYINQGFFVEYSNAYGNYYGTSKESLSNIKNKELRFLILDRVGVDFIKNKINDSIFIWILPPSMQELEKRLILRNANTLRSCRRRLSLAKKELLLEKESPIFDHHIINDNINITINKLKNIINAYI